MIYLESTYSFRENISFNLYLKLQNEENYYKWLYLSKYGDYKINVNKTWRDNYNNYDEYLVGTDPIKSQNFNQRIEVVSFDDRLYNDTNEELENVRSLYTNSNIVTPEICELG